MGTKDLGKVIGAPATFQIPSPAGGVQMETHIPWTPLQRGVRRNVITPFDTPIELIDEATRERRQRELEQPSPLLRALGFPRLHRLASQHGLRYRPRPTKHS